MAGGAAPVVGSSSMMSRAAWRRRFRSGNGTPACLKGLRATRLQHQAPPRRHRHGQAVRRVVDLAPEAAVLAECAHEPAPAVALPPLDRRLHARRQIGGECLHGRLTLVRCDKHLQLLYPLCRLLGLAAGRLLERACLILSLLLLMTMLMLMLPLLLVLDPVRVPVLVQEGTETIQITRLVHIVCPYGRTCGRHDGQDAHKQGGAAPHLPPWLPAPSDLTMEHTTTACGVWLASLQQAPRSQCLADVDGGLIERA